MTCCPLSQCDESATVYTTIERVARKEHVCFECRETIPSGTTYEHISMLFDGSWDSFKLCLSCREIGDHFTCGSRTLGTLWEELKENFFPDMRMGGPCIAGLSPTAKLKLVERRMAWYLERDEVDDSDWEDWPKHRDRQRPRAAPIEREEVVPYHETPEYFWKRELELDAFRATKGTPEGA